MAIELKAEEIAVLSHVVEDPAAWLAGAYAGFSAHGGSPEEVEARVRSALDQKVARWKPIAEAERTKLGVAYKPRADREVISAENVRLIRPKKL
jgi:hypothetical protein